MVSFFCTVNTTGDNKNDIQISILFIKSKIVEIHSGNIESTIKVKDFILEMPRLGVLCY